MYAAQELINDSGISVIGAAFFTGLFAFLTVIANNLFKARAEVRELGNATAQTLESAEAVQKNTEKVSNGFTDRVDKRLDTIVEYGARNEIRINELQKAIQGHLEWHLNERL